MKQFLNPMKLRRPMAWLLAAAMMGQNLPLFAVAEEDPNAGTICGYVAHTHGESCDILQNKLICKLPEGEGHTHDVQECFRQEQKLICQEEHEHAKACHETVNVQSCPLQEYVAHTHGDACYTQEKVRICTVTEHTHTEQCYPVVVPETTEAIETCEHCGVELVENAVHAENCLTRCTCGQETHVSPCPLYVTPKTCEHCGVELVENAVHAEDCLTRCTCGQETHVSPCPFYVEPELSFYEKLLAAKTMEEFFQLMNSDVDTVMAFTTEELKALKEYVKKTYAAMTEPSQDEQDYYAEILAGFDVLLEEEAPVEEPANYAADGIIEFDISKGDVKLTDDGYSGFNSNGENITGDHDESHIYVISQSNNDVATTHTISVGETDSSTNDADAGKKTYVTVTENFIIKLNGVNIQNPTDGVCALSVNNSGDSVVAIILAKNTSNKLFSGKFRAGLEKSGGASSDGTLVISCEEGYENWCSDPTDGHRDSNDYSACDSACGSLDARSGNAWTNSTTDDEYRCGAGIGTAGYGSDGVNEPGKASGTNALVNLTIAGGNITASGGRGMSKGDSSGGGACIGVGSASGTGKTAGTITGLKITGGTINLWRTDNSTACIGGGYRAGYVNIEIYGGTITTSDDVSAGQNHTTLTQTTKVRAAGIGGGGGGLTTSSPAGAYVIIYGGKISAEGQYGAAIGAGAGGAEGSAQAGYVDIRGGHITAKTTPGNGNGAGAAIGTGGSLGTGRGGKATVTISCGTIIAYSEKGADIGGGGTSSTEAAAVGGEAIVTITGGDITSQHGGIGGGRANAGKGGNATVNISGGTIDGTTIGGGASVSNTAGTATVAVSGTANVTLSDIIGGGNSTSGQGGNASVTVSGGSLTTKAIGGGNSSTGAPGNIDGNEGNPGIQISGGILNTGTIGGGTNAANQVGYASAKVTGGTIRGQFVMKAPASGNCTFEMTGGTINNTDLFASGYNHPIKLGGAVYMDDPNGVVTISGGTIQNCKAENGGAVYMTAGTFTLSGTGIISDCEVTDNGGAVYLGSVGENKGTLNMQGGSITGNVAKQHGGGAYLDGGSVNMTAGTIAGNSASLNGGGAAVDNGNFTMSGGLLGNADNGNKATSGGGVYVSGGHVNITDTAKIICNEADDGGGVYLTGGSFTQNGADTSIENNTATRNGGGVYLDKITPELESGSITDNTAHIDGGGIYIDQEEVNLTPTGAVSITRNTANGNGGGICISGTYTNPAGFAIADDSTGSITMTGNKAAYGGAVCIENGTFDLENDKITVTGNEATNGGGVAVLSGTFTMTGGSLGASGSANKATLNAAAEGGNGGGVYVSGGSALVKGGKVEGNTAFNGGGVYVTNGGVVMSGGEISHNTGSSNGGGVFVEAGTGQNAVVNIYSGSILSNTTNGGGGAVSIKGSETSNIDIQIGVNDIHKDPLNISHKDTYGTYTHKACPVINNNKSGTDGGAVFISGGDLTNFKIYCLTENNNTTGTGENARSNFMKVEGGTVLISTSKTQNGAIDADTSGYGNIDINGSIHVTGGKVDIYGVMSNPDFADRITVDIKDASNDHYEDHRPGDSNTKKLRYFENFKNPDGSVTGQYTDYMHRVGTTVTISGNIYSHPGYKIVGWYTENDQTIQDGTWYEVAKQYALNDDLTIYAIWEVYGYTVRFYPNCDSYGGTEMEKQDFTIYPDGETQIGVALRTNTYTRPGYKFIGWNTKANGSGTSYTNGQAVVNLSTEDGAEVPLYAQWAECDHINTVTFWSAKGDTLIGTCECGNKEWKARLTAADAVYDEKQHGAALVYAAADETLFSSLTIEYKKGVEVLSETPVNAGTYTANVSKGGAIASITYTIEKAEQKAPDKPVYVPVITPETTENGVITPASSVLTIDKINDSDQTGAAAVYVLEYYNASNKLQRVEQYLNSDGTHYIQKTYTDADVEPNETQVPVQDGKGAVFSLNYALTHYYVYAYYQEMDNYNASDRTSADQVYFHEGNVRIIIDGDGKITGEIIENDAADGLEIKLTNHEGYYRGRDFTVTAVTRNPNNTANHLQQAQVSLNGSKNAVLEGIPNDCVITVTIRGMEKCAAITAAVEPGQKFSKISGTQTKISQDSAFTASYTITDFVPEKYKASAESTPNIQTMLKFSEELPEGTTIILLENGRYWKASVSGDSLNLGAFTRMGEDGSNNYALNRDGTLQFIVDFSRTQNPPAAGTLKMTLSIKDDGNFVPTAETDVEVTLQKISSFVLSSDGPELTQKVTYTYTQYAKNASIWEGRNAALVLTPPDNLPSDALLRVKDGEYTTVYRKNADRKYIIPLSGLQTRNVTITLESSGFPADETTYTFDAQWYVSNSMAGSGPMDGKQVANTDVVFVKPEQQTPSAKLTGDKTLYNRNEDLQVTLTGSALKNVEVKLYYKKFTENSNNYQYEDTAYNKQIVWDETNPTFNWAIDLQAFEQEGTYCLELTARDGVTIILDNVRYFFILK